MEVCGAKSVVCALHSINLLINLCMKVLGDTLTTGWPSILAVLEDSATRNDLDAGRVVRLGHECLEAVVADFLPLLPRPLLRRALHIEACFVMQVSHEFTALYTCSAVLSCMQNVCTAHILLELLRLDWFSGWVLKLY